jgi:hypothetical protein
MPPALTDNQLRIVMAAAGGLARVVAQPRGTNGDLGRAVQAALRDVMQAPAA